MKAKLKVKAKLFCCNESFHWNKLESPIYLVQLIFGNDHVLPDLIKLIFSYQQFFLLFQGWFLSALLEHLSILLSCTLILAHSPSVSMSLDPTEKIVLYWYCFSCWKKVPWKKMVALILEEKLPRFTNMGGTMIYNFLCRKLYKSKYLFRFLYRLCKIQQCHKENPKLWNVILSPAFGF